MDIAGSILLIILSTVIIAKVCDGFETAADYLGRKLSNGVKGATINAVGSSMPELFATMVFLFLFADTTGFAGGVGTTAGSAVFNTMVIPALSIFAAIKIFKISSVNVSRKVLVRDGLALILAEFLLIVLLGDHLTWVHGAILMGFYLLYVTYMLKTMDASEEDDGEDDDEDDQGEIGSRFFSFFKLDLEDAFVGNNDLNSANAWVLLIVSTCFIALGCWVLVHGCESFGAAMGIEGYFVAVILAAAASSIPDTILSVKDAKKGNYDDAVSNALGSNIFDICFALGFPLMLFCLIYGPINVDSSTLSDISELRVLLLVLTAASFLVFVFGNGMGKAKAWLLIIIYSLFTAYVIGSAYDMTWVIPTKEFILMLNSHIPTITL